MTVLAKAAEVATEEPLMAENPAMATMVAIRHNPPIRAFYQRLTTAGRPQKLAVIAAMRKLVTILNAMLRDQRPWQPA